MMRHFLLEEHYQLKYMALNILCISINCPDPVHRILPCRLSIVVIHNVEQDATVVNAHQGNNAVMPKTIVPSSFPPNALCQFLSFHSRIV